MAIFIQRDFHPEFPPRAGTLTNERLFDACFLWAFAALSTSQGARRYYDLQRGRGKTHNQALRALANRLVGILHGCLRNRQLYSEETAWPVASQKEIAA